jgi:ubiquinone biosynthesis protein COQ4
MEPMTIHAMLARRGYDLPRARAALDALLADPDDLPRVFTLIDALSGRTTEQLVARLARDEAGAALLRDRPDIVAHLRDRDALRSLPEGSLGRAYLRFVEAEGISAEGIITAAEEGRAGPTEADPSLQWVRQRMRDTHDLWHALTGYQGDVAGEVALLAFSLGQVRNPGVAVIVLTALLRGLARSHGALVLDGFVRGTRAAWLPAQRWEALLALPLDEVRARLRVGAPASYEPVRTQQLRAEGLLTQAA